MRYLVEMRDNAGAADIERARSALLANAAVKNAAARRKRFGGDERWWSVGAGVIIVLLLVMYSFNWETAANIAAVSLFVYMAFVMCLIIYKRVSLKRTPLEIDPREAVAALFSNALGQKCDARVAPMLAGSEFSKTLSPLCEELAGGKKEWDVKVEVNLKMLTSEARDVIKIPCAVTLREKGGDTEVTCEYMAAFVSAGGDDFTVADLCPEIIGRAELSPLTRLTALSTVGWDDGISDRWRAMSAK